MATSTLPVPSASKSSAAAHGILLDAGTNEVEILVFRVGEQHCGVNVAKVRQVHTVEHTTFLPRFPESVDGVIPIRNAVVPAVDLQKYLWGTTQRGEQTDERHLLLEFNNQLIAFRVEAVDRVHRVSWTDILPVPQGLGKDVSMTGIVHLGGRIITLLDFESIAAELGLSGGTQVSKDSTVEAAMGATRCPLVFADDSALIRRMMEDALGQAGYEDVRIFTDGQEAWDYLQEVARQNTSDSIRQSLSAIITDVEMPRMDGFSLTKKIREDQVLKDLPVILFSSLVSKDNEKKGRQVGATAQISKPKWEELASTLLAVLGEVMHGGGAADAAGQNQVGPHMILNPS